MKVNPREFRGSPEEFTSSESNAPAHEELPQVVKSLEAELQFWMTGDVSHAIWLLSQIADDELICPQNPTRVIEALQNHGHLLCDYEIEMLRHWLVQLGHSQEQENTTTEAAAR